jgi:hypothetical protein
MGIDPSLRRSLLRDWLYSFSELTCRQSLQPDLVYCLPGADPAGSGNRHDCLRWRLRIDAKPTVKSDA